MICVPRRDVVRSAGLRSFSRSRPRILDATSDSISNPRVPHQSENARRLTIHTVGLADLQSLPTPRQGVADVWLFVLPFERTVRSTEALRRFVRSLDGRSIVAILTSPA